MIITVKVLIVNSNEIKTIAINQRQICSVEKIDAPEPQNSRTLVRMSNGDKWEVIDPPYNAWMLDFDAKDSDY